MKIQKQNSCKFKFFQKHCKKREIWIKRDFFVYPENNKNFDWADFLIWAERMLIIFQILNGKEMFKFFFCNGYNVNDDNLEIRNLTKQKNKMDKEK